MITISTSTATVTIPRNASQETTTGTRLPGIGLNSYGAGVDLGAVGGSGILCSGVLVIDRITKLKARELIDFIANKTRFGIVPCSIHAEYCDLGYGIGNTVPYVYFDMDGDTKDYIYRVGTFDKYEVRLPYKYWMDTSGGHATRR